MNEMHFPYPYVINALDKYYGVVAKPVTLKIAGTEKDKDKDSKRKKKDKKDKAKKRKSKSGKKLRILIATFWDY
ncbi:MAG: hypothetical protein AB2401_09840, partial [Bacillus sp. (in: firmicutes)]